MGDNKVNKSEKEEFITIEEINEILGGYHIGKKPLAKLLGWGETTIIRYTEGDVPTREYSDKLRWIMKNPEYFGQILEKNKDSLTPVAYRKCSQAVKEKLLESKIRIVAQYIINRLEGRISLYELQIYLYYIQGFYLAMEEQAMFEDDYMINDHDMPYQVVYEDYKVRNITTLELQKNALTEKESNYINDVVEALSWYGPAMLDKMVHYERMMLKLSRDRGNHKIISKETMTNHFRDVIITWHIRSTEDIHTYLEQMYIKLVNAEWNI